jgi:polyferredoxin
MRLDPLLALAHLLSARALLAGSALSLVTLVLTVLFGRVWCGWLCPLGTLLDVLPLRGLRSGTLDGAEFLRRIKYVLLAATVGAALLASLSLLVLDPLTILTRALAAGLWPALGGLVTALEQALYRVEPLRGWVSAFDPLLRPWLISSLPLEYEGSLPTVFLLLAIMMLGILAERFWCRYVCPLGGLLGLVSKLAVVRRLVDPACKGCLVCSRVCPTGTIRPSQGYASDPGECTVCMECIDACPRSMNRFGMAQSRIAGWNAYDPTRRQALASIGAGFLSVGLLRLTSKDAGPLLRPPGASERRLLETCVRCGACIRVCPTGALHPSLGEGGPEGLWTPRLLPRQGYCDYGCTACGSVCPVQAIPPLRLEEKRERIIGTAAVDRDRCFPWSSDRECIVCEEMCPLPGKAIRLEEVPVSRDGVGPSTIQRPIVLEEECIGCGICENKCPVEGEAAIRVKPLEGIEA